MALQPILPLFRNEYGVAPVSYPGGSFTKVYALLVRITNLEITYADQT